MLINQDLRKAYDQIKGIYNKENIRVEKVFKIIHCNKWNILLTDQQNVGVAFNFTGDHAVYGSFLNLQVFEDCQKYIGESLFTLVEYLLTLEGIQERAICLATLNALSQGISSQEDLDQRGIQSQEKREFDFIRESDVVTLIGYGGVIDEIRGKCKEFNVLDMRSISSLQKIIVGENIDYFPLETIFRREIESKEVISKSDVVIMTGSTLVNGTFRDIIKNAQKARVIGMFGPSAQIIPEFLLDEGINFISSNRWISSCDLYNIILDPFSSNVNFHPYSESYFIKSNFFNQNAKN